MNIVQLVMRRQYRGAEIFAGQLSQQLASAGVNVLYVSLYKPPHEAYQPVGVKWLDLNVDKSGIISFSLINQLHHCFKSFKPDIVQANAGDTLKYAVFVKILFNHQYKIIFRNASTISAYLKNPIKRFFQGLLLRKVDAIFSVSNLSKADITNIFPGMTDRTIVIPIGIEIGRENIFCERLSFSFEKRPVFVHVGGFTFEKNHNGLISIFEKYLTIDDNSSLLLIGDGPLKSEIEKLVAKKNLTTRVTFLGNRKDVRSIIANADALLLPSNIEGLPAVLLEACTVKVAVVAYDVGGIHEVIKNEETGWLIDKGDENAFVSSMRSAISKTEGVKLIIENAFTFVTRRFNLNDITKSFLSAYVDVLNHKSKS